MAKRGRKPKPTALHILQGSKPRVARHEPEAPKGRPEMPARLGVDPIAKATWEQLSEILWSMGVLTIADGEALATLCEVHSAEQACLLELRATGPTIHTELGGVKPNPAGSLFRSLSGLKTTLMSEFGMTPSSRTKVAAPRETPKDELEAFLKTYG